MNVNVRYIRYGDIVLAIIDNQNSLFSLALHPHDSIVLRSFVHRVNINRPHEAIVRPTGRDESDMIVKFATCPR